MNKLKTLVYMQLKEKLNLKGKKVSKKTILFSSIFSLLKFMLVIGLCYILLYIVKLLQLFSLIDIIPTSVIAIVFGVMLLVSIVSCTFGLTKAMYYSSDNPVLLTFPCRSTQVYVSKLIIFYIFELKRNFSFMIPLFVAYGILHGFTPIYYPWMILCFIFISLLSVLLGALLSIPMMYFYNLFRQYKWLQIISFLIVVAIVTASVVGAISIIPNNIDLLGTWGSTFWKIQDYLKEFTIKFNYLYQLVVMMVGVRVNLTYTLFLGSTVSNFFYLILFDLILFGLGLLIVRPIFYKMASKPFEYRKEKVKAKRNIVSSKRFTTFKTEFLLNVRNPEKLFVNVGLLVSIPVLIFLLNKCFGAMNTRLLGDNLSVAFNMLIILLIALTSNYYAASVFSKDGRSSYLIKVQPSKYQPLLFSKLLISTIFMLLSLTATFFVLLNNTRLGLDKSIIFYLTTVLIYLAHLFYSAELDIMNPQVELYATMGDNENNPNETKSTVLAFLVSFLVFGMMIFLLQENSGLLTYLKLFFISLVMMIFRLYMLVNKIKLYYKEK